MANDEVGVGRFKRAGLMVFVLTLVAGGVLVGWRAKMRAASGHRLARLEGRARAATFQGQLRHAVAALEVLGAVSSQNGGPVPNFQEVGAQLRRAWPELVTLELQPSGVVGEVVPRTGYERVMGFNVFKDPTQSAAAWGALRGRAVTLSAPVRLYRGDPGLVLRAPIFRRERDGRETFWGFVAVSMGMAKTLAQARPDELESALRLELGTQAFELVPSPAPHDRWGDAGVLAIEGLAVLVAAGLLWLLVDLLNTESLQERLAATEREAQTAARAAQTEIGQVRAALRQAQETIRQLRERPEPAVRVERSAPAMPAAPPASRAEKNAPARAAVGPAVQVQKAAVAEPAAPVAKMERVTSALVPPAVEPEVQTQEDTAAQPTPAVAKIEKVTSAPAQPAAEPPVPAKESAPVVAAMDSALAAATAQPSVTIETVTSAAAQAVPKPVDESEKRASAKPLAEPAAGNEKEASALAPPVVELAARPPALEVPALRGALAKPKPPPKAKRKKARLQPELDLFAAPGGQAEGPRGIMIGGSEGPAGRAHGAAEEEKGEGEAEALEAERPGSKAARSQDRERRASPEREAEGYSPVNAAQLRKAANQLLPLLAGQDPGARDCLADNRQVFQSAFAAGAYADFEQSVRKRDFDSAQEQLKRAMKRHGLL